MRPTWGLWYWPLWLTITGLTFGPAELVALFTNAANTLSEYSRYEIGIHATVNPHTIPWWVSLLAWCLFVVVITIHIWFTTDTGRLG